MMKQMLIYCILFIVFGSCGSNSNKVAEDNKEIISEQERKLQHKKENKLEETVTGKPSEDKNCNSSELHVYLNDPDDSGTNIRNRPGGDVVLELVKKGEDIEFFLILTASENGWFKVKSPIGGMENDVEIPNNEGWVHNSVISVDTRNYGGEDLQLLDQPKTGKVVGVIEEESHRLRIKDLCGTWVKLEYKGVIGWIESSWLCGNPLTNCS